MRIVFFNLALFSSVERQFAGMAGRMGYLARGMLWAYWFVVEDLEA